VCVLRNFSELTAKHLPFSDRWRGTHTAAMLRAVVLLIVARHGGVYGGVLRTASGKVGSTSITASHGRKFYHPTNSETAGGLTKNDFVKTHTTQLYASTDEEPKEWISVTPAGIFLKDHDGAITEWNKGGGMHNIGTQWGVDGYFAGAGISSSHGSDSWSSTDPVHNDGLPRSILTYSETSYMIQAPTELGEQSFLLTAPFRSVYTVPGCPNWNVTDCKSGHCGPAEAKHSDCPRRSLHAGEWKTSILGLVHGTDINSLSESDPPKNDESYDKSAHYAENDRDLADYSDIIHRTALDLGALGAAGHVHAWISDADGKETNLSDVSEGTNIGQSTLHLWGEHSGGLQYKFVPTYAIGTFTRKMSDMPCNAGTPVEDGDFSTCSRDVTGFNDPPDSLPGQRFHPPLRPTLLHFWNLPTHPDFTLSAFDACCRRRRFSSPQVGKSFEHG
jgi:hypothetical protein